MHWRHFAIVTVGMLSMLVLAACGGGSGDDDNGSSPEDGAGGSDAVRAYASDLCGPFETFFNDAGDLLLSFEETDVDPEADLEEAFEALADVVEPMQRFVDDIREVDAPDELRDYHDAIIEQLEYAADAIEAISEGGFFAAFLLPTPPAAPEEPAGFDDAIVDECGEELASLFEDLGSDVFSEGEGDPAITVEPIEESAPVRGSVGEAVSNGDVELTIHGMQDPYPPTDEFFSPEAGNRWVVVDVSITNTSSEPLDYNMFDFRVKDAEDFEYDAGAVDVDRELGFASLIPGDTVRGNVGFEVPEGVEIARVIYEPGFFGEGRIDIDLE